MAKNDKDIFKRACLMYFSWKYAEKELAIVKCEESNPFFSDGRKTIVFVCISSVFLILFISMIERSKVGGRFIMA